MASTVILNNFKSPELWRNKYRRSTYEIWDANLHHGDVRPFACPEQICENFYRMLYPIAECDCVGFTQFRSIVRGFSAQQHYEIISGRLRHINALELCADGESHLAGSPTPANPIDTVTTGECNSEVVCDTTGVTYVITYVVNHSGILIESAPSPPTEPVAATSTPNVTVSWSAAPVGLSDYNIVATRLYRLESTFEDGTDAMAPHGSEYVFLEEFPGSGAVVHLDVASSSATGGPLTTYDPMAFPAPNNLVAVARTSDGLVVADSYRVYISESGKPQFTWDGVVEIEDEIRHIVAINNTIFVFTNNKPVKIGFQHTDGVMSIDRQVIQRSLPLYSRESVSVYNNSVYFSSTHSLYSWNTGRYGSDLNAVFKPMVSPEQWRNIDPYSVVGTAYEFGYIFTSDSIDYSLMVEFTEGNENSSSVIPISYINPNTFATDIDGHIIYSDTTGTYKWDWRRLVDPSVPYNVQDNARLHLTDLCECCPWKLVMYYDNEGKNRFSKMRVEWDERSATHLDVKFFLKAFGNEEEITGTLKVISSRGFSIPKFKSAQTFCVEVSGCGIMHEIRLATSSQELVFNSNNLIGNSGED